LLKDKQPEARTAAQHVAAGLAAAAEATQSPHFFLEEIPANPSADWDLNDSGNALRLAARFGHVIRCVDSNWLAFDGCSWRHGSIAVLAATDTVVRRMADEVATAERKLMLLQKDSDEYKIARDQYGRIRAHKLRSGQVHVRRSMMDAAACLPGIARYTTDFDKHAHLLCVGNGTIDLHSGELLAHSPDDYITQRIALDYDAAATCPQWERCMLEWMQGDVAQVEYLQRVFGYAITGSTEERQFWFFTGADGGNGKSTALNLIRSILGSYALTAPGSLIADAQPGKSSMQDAVLAQLQGKRFVILTETDGTSRLSSAAIKSIVSDDEITGKALYRQPITFKPTHHVFWAVNGLPTFDATDDATMSRVRVVVWNFKPTQQDTSLGQKLWQERAGILRWLVDGARRWYALRDAANHGESTTGGLHTPVAMVQAQKEELEDQDVLQSFLQECCVVSDKTPDGYDVPRVSVGDMYIRYIAWCRESNMRPMSKISLSKKLVKAGIQKIRDSSGRWWRGVWFK
jgi:putative DNA primase/helicase